MPYTVVAQVTRRLHPSKPCPLRWAISSIASSFLNVFCIFNVPRTIVASGVHVLAHAQSPAVGHPAGDGGVLAGGNEEVDDGGVASLVAGGVEGDNVGKEGLGGGVVVPHISLEVMWKRGVVFEPEAGREVR